jgi:hypothetical protein
MIRPKIKRTLAAMAMVAVVVTGLAGCNRSSNAKAAKAISPASGLEYITGYYRSRAEGAVMTGGWYRTLDEMLPNVTYASSTGQSTTLPTTVVVGRITDVEPGKGFRIEGDDAADGLATDFSDARAKWFMAHATVKVDHAIGSNAPSELTVAFPSEGPSSFAKLRAGLKALGTVVLVLRHDDRRVAYDPSLYTLIEDDGLVLATVASDGTLAMPLLAPGRPEALLATTPKLSDLENKGKLPRVVPMIGTGEDAKRADGK